jgi:hypothetical protein
MFSPETQRWLAKAFIVVEAVADGVEAIQFKMACDGLNGLLRQSKAQQIVGTIYRVSARLETTLNQTSSNAFIAPGDLWGAYVGISNLLAHAKSDLFVVDPYLDDSLLIEYGGHIADGVRVRLLSSGLANRFAQIHPAIARWNVTYPSRTIALKVAPKSLVHDRVVILDGQSAWIVTQSIKDVGKKAPATVMRFDDTMKADKIAVYENLWATAEIPTTSQNPI